MSYVISGTTVNSVDYTDYPFGGAAGNGNALSSANYADGGWISYTFDRPDVRVHPDGHSYFTVKNVSFRTCSAPGPDDGPGVASRMYGRVSYADGSAFVNSYKSSKTGLFNQISWQKAPTVTYSFQGTVFHVKDDIDGGTIRVWLISGGPFLFQRNSGGTGHVVGSGGQTWAGSPAGYVTISEIASPPQNFTAVRVAKSPQQITMTWAPELHAGGSKSGYVVQVAENPSFTVGVRYYYPAIKSGGALVYLSTGYSQSKAYYIRIATRNETSEWFNLKGGQWSATVTVPTFTGTIPNPPADTGVEGGTSGSGANGNGASTTTSPGGSDGSQGSAAPVGSVVTGSKTSTGAVVGGSSGTTAGGQPNDPTDTSGDGSATGTSGSAGTSPSGTDGSTPTTGTGSGAATIIYAPIPDTSADRASKFGRLISRQPTSTETRVFLYDRGGKRRLGELTQLSQVHWNRVRDDMSSATIQMSATAADGPNRAVLARLGVARSEIVIYRGNQRVWEGPVTRAAYKRSGVEIGAQDVLWYARCTVMRDGYSNAYPNGMYVVDRIAGIMTAEMTRLETPVLDVTGETTLVPAINVLPFLHTYVDYDDAMTYTSSGPYSTSVFDHLDDLAARSGIDYTVVGRAIHIWDTSKAAMGRTRTVSEQDFIGDPYVTEYGSDVATVFSVTDGQGNFASFFNATEIEDPYYGQLEMLATAYGAQTVTTTTDLDTGATVETTTNNTVSFDAMSDQATRGAKGRDPAPGGLTVPANSAIDVSRSGLGLDVLIPGVYVPILATFSGREFDQIQKIDSVDVVVTGSKSGYEEAVSVSLSPASSDDTADAQGDAG